MWLTHREEARPLAVTDVSNYRSHIEQKGIEEHRSYINTQMQQARETRDPAQRSRCLSNAIAANGMLLRGMEVGFITAEPNYKAIQDISQGIQTTRAFRSLMEDCGERLAQNGSVDALVRDLQERDRQLAENELPSRPAIEVIHGIQAKVRAQTAQPRDFAMLVATHRLSSWRGKTRAPDGKVLDVVRRDLSRQLDGRTLGEEAERVMQDPDFRYVMRHEKKENLYLSALRVNGTALEQYPRRAEQLRAREAEKSNAPPGQTKAESAAHERKASGPERQM